MQKADQPPTPPEEWVPEPANSGNQGRNSFWVPALFMLSLIDVDSDSLRSESRYLQLCSIEYRTVPSYLPTYSESKIISKSKVSGSGPYGIKETVTRDFRP